MAWRATILLLSVAWVVLAPVVGFAVAESALAAREPALQSDQGTGPTNGSWEPAAARAHGLDAPREGKPRAPGGSASFRSRVIPCTVHWRERTRPGVTRAYPPRRQLRPARADSPSEIPA